MKLRNLCKMLKGDVDRAELKTELQRRVDVERVVRGTLGRKYVKLVGHQHGKSYINIDGVNKITIQCQIVGIGVGAHGSNLRTLWMYTGESESVVELCGYRRLSFNAKENVWEAPEGWKEVLKARDLLDAVRQFGG